MIDEFFVTPIYQKILDLDCSEIEKCCLEYQQNHNGVIISNIGGWQSENINGVLNYTWLDQLKRHIFSGMKEIHKKYELTAKNMLIDNIWININGQHSYNRAHTHGGGFFSGVFYVNVPENSGDIYFHHPSIHAHTYNGIEFAPNLIGNKVITPIQNALLLFPSWILHEVEINKSVDKRISISFNIIIKN